MNFTAASYPIMASPLWDVWDNTKLSSYMRCPRLAFYEHILGWRFERGQHDLVFGQWWHEVQEYLMQNGYSARSQVMAAKIFITRWRAHYGLDMDDNPSFKAKAPGYVMNAIQSYCEQYDARDAKDVVLDTEAPVSVALDIDGHRELYVKVDSLLHNSRGYLTREHKTTGWTLNQLWESQWSLSTQVHAQHHVLYSLFNPRDIYGVEINGTGFFKKGIEHKRVHIKRSVQSMQAWLVDMNLWFDRLEADFLALSKTGLDDDQMSAFPRDPNSCTKYFRLCPYHTLCLSRHNPLKWNCSHAPDGFCKFFWDPRVEDEPLNLEEPDAS